MFQVTYGTVASAKLMIFCLNVYIHSFATNIFFKKQHLVIDELNRCIKSFVDPFLTLVETHILNPEKNSALSKNCFLFVQRKMLFRTLLLIGIVQAVVFSVPLKNKKDKGNVNNYSFLFLVYVCFYHLYRAKYLITC